MTNMQTQIKVVRRKGPAWIFTLEKTGDFTGYYIHRTKRNIYALMIDTGEYPDIWIGLFWKAADGRRCFGTIEDRLGAIYAQIGRGRYYWREE